MQDSWKQLKSDSTSWRKTLTSSDNLQNQWHVVSTPLPRDEKSTDPKGWIRGNTKIGPVLEVTTSHLQGKYGVEIRIESVNKDNSHSWVRISHGLNKLVMNLNNNEYDDNEQETSETKSEEFALKTNVLSFASRSKAKAKPRRPTCSSARTVPFCERIWTDIEPGTQFESSVPSGKKTKHSSSAWTITSRRRWGDRILETGRLSSEQTCALSTLVWWNVEEYNGKRRRKKEKDFNTVLTRHDKKFFTSEFFKVIQDAIPLIHHYRDNVLIPNDFFEKFYHIGCAVTFTLHHKFRIDSGRTKFKQEKTDGTFYSRESHE